MATSRPSFETNSRLETVSEQLPDSRVREYDKGQTIYSPEHPSTSIYLVMSGMVQLSQITGNGGERLVEIIGPGELCGESAFLGVPCCSEQATAFERASAMTWDVSDVEALVMERPRLSLALLQALVRRNVEATRRIESFSTEGIERRLAGALAHFAERLGTTEEDGSSKMKPLTHLLLARYVGTSREIITHFMNEFRKQGYISYSRQGIVLHNGKSCTSPRQKLHLL
jgi:CRP/FNR family transcriptional regulator